MSTIAVDWDGVLVEPVSQQWLPGAVEALRQLAARHTVVVHTCRANWPEGLASVEARLIAVALPSVTVWVDAGKPSADLYVDDRAVFFDGDWARMLNVIAGAEQAAVWNGRVTVAQSRRRAARGVGIR